MKPERLTELATLHAAGALEGADLQEYQTLLAGADFAAQSEIGRWNDLATAAAIAQSPPRPAPAKLKARVLANITGASTAPAPATKRAADFYSIVGSEGEWQTLAVPGVRVKNLAEDARRGLSVKLYELAPGTHFPEHHHTGPEECFVVSGDFHVEGRVLHGGDFHHAEAESDHGESFTVGGCTLLVMVATADYQ